MAIYLLAWKIVILWGTIVESLDTQRSRIARVIPKHDVVLDSGPNVTFTDVSKLECLSLCIPPNCSSFNYGNRTCELFDTYYCKGNLTLREKPGFKYYDVEDGLLAQDLRMYHEHVNCINLHRCSPKCYDPPYDCSAVFPPVKQDGSYTIYPSCSEDTPVNVACHLDVDGVWTIIQRRFNGSVNFYRNWTDYKNGFGHVDGEYWLGNDVIYELTSNATYELIITLTDFDDVTKYARYSRFNIEDESNFYRLSVGGWSGTAKDSFMLTHKGQFFSTLDNDKDSNIKENCAEKYRGGWWYNGCHTANLNGPYIQHGQPMGFAKGIIWRYWRGYEYSLKTSTMMIRRV